MNELKKVYYGEILLEELKEKCYAIKVKDHTDKEMSEKASTMHKMVVAKHKEIESKRAEFKKDSLEYGRYVDSEAKKYLEPLEEMKKYLFDQKNIVALHEKRLEEERLKKEEEERLKKEAEREAEYAARQKENEELKRQIEEQKAFERIRQEEQEKANKAVEEEKLKAIKAQEQLKEDVERARLRGIADAEYRIQAEKDRVKAEAAEKERKDLEEKEKALLAPDKEKLKVFSSSLADIQIPVCKEPKAQAIVSLINNSLLKLKSYIDEKIENL